MKDLFTISLALLLGLAACQQKPKEYSFPRTGAEDSEHIMSEKYWSYWTPEVQAKIDADIEKNRKGNAQFVVEGVTEGTAIKVEQISSDFTFSASAFNWDQLGNARRNKRYKELFGTLFNRAIIPLYWSTTELEQGHKRFFPEERDSEEWWNKCGDPNSQPHWRRPPSEPIIEWCEKHNVAMHGHPLLWGHVIQTPSWQREGVPAHELAALDTLDKFLVESPAERHCPTYNNLSADEIAAIVPEYTRILDERMYNNMRELMTQYEGRIDTWDVVNESYFDHRDNTLVPGAKLTKSTRFGLMPGDYVYRAYKLAEELNNGKALLYINETMSDSKYENADIYSDQVKHLLKRGAKIDVIGIQMHLARTHRNTEHVAQGKEFWTPEKAYYIFDKLAENNLPLCMSETTITSPGSDYRGEMIQAIVATNLFRLWFSYPTMNSINWWNIVDGCGYKDDPTISGLFTRDMKPKLAYYAVSNLILKEWRTNETLYTDADGKISWRGFKGKYRITWNDSEGKDQSVEYHLK